MHKQDIINKALAEVGTTEYPPNSNTCKYNTWYYNNKEVSGSAFPWCAVFISWLFNGTNLVKKTASCMDMAQDFKNKKRWFTSPKIGDIVFYKFGNSNRWTNHVGLVIEVSNKSITTIEGNTSSSSQGSQSNGGMVAKRIRKSSIVGYGRPSYTEDATYYPSYDGSSVAIDEIFRAIGVDERYIGGWEKRKPIASANGYPNYRGTGKENTDLCNKAREGQLKRI